MASGVWWAKPFSLSSWSKDWKQKKKPQWYFSKRSVSWMKNWENGWQFMILTEKILRPSRMHWKTGKTSGKGLLPDRNLSLWSGSVKTISYAVPQIWYRMFWIPIRNFMGNRSVSLSGMERTCTWGGRMRRRSVSKMKMYIWSRKPGKIPWKKQKPSPGKRLLPVTLYAASCRGYWMMAGY